MKASRQDAILELVEKYEIETQDDLIERLRQSGFEVTQATVSRDIRELKLTKVLTGHGGYRYILPPKESGLAGSKLNHALLESIVMIDVAMRHILVLLRQSRQVWTPSTCPKSWAVLPETIP